MDDMEFTPDYEDETLPGTMTVEFQPATTASEFKSKADGLMSDAMDYLSAKIRSGMAEASDIKTAVDIGKMFKVGIETVDEAAQRAMAEASKFDDLDEEPMDVTDAMRFEE